MEKKLGAVMIVIVFFVFMLIGYKCLRSNDQSRTIDSEVSEKVQEQLVPDIIHEWDGVNVGPRPSEMIVPTETGFDSIPVNTENTGESEKAQEQLVSDVIHEWDGVNVGPWPSEMILPTITGIDSIPVNTENTGE